MNAIRPRSGGIRFHPLAELFPLMEGDAFAALIADIRSNGLREPVVVHDGLILDGRNRVRACEVAGMRCETRPHDGSDPLAFVISANLQRRHLDESQRAMVAARIAKLPRGSNQHPPNDGPSAVEAATMLNVGTRSIERARVVIDRAAPEVVAAVERGEIAVSVAARIAEMPATTQREVAANPARAPHAVKRHRREMREVDFAARTEAASQRVGARLYGVIYADPPWRFEPYSRDTGLDRAADNHYPTMTLDDIAALRVPAADDCALFLWATVPMLPQALHIIDRWGFAYRSHFVWIKDRAGTGYWARNQHELLLIATRGDVPAPAPEARYASVQQFSVLAHSAKPALFAEMIEEMFPSAPRLEMFARGARAGWDVWGNEVALA